MGIDSYFSAYEKPGEDKLTQRQKGCRFCARQMQNKELAGGKMYDVYSISSPLGWLVLWENLELGRSKLGSAKNESNISHGDAYFSAHGS